MCPLLMTIMRDPVFTRDGHCYERSAIENWLAENDTSPLTGSKLEDKTLVPAMALRKCIEEWRETVIKKIPIANLQIKEEIGRGSMKIACRAYFEGQMVAVINLLDKSQSHIFAEKIMAWTKLPAHPRLARLHGVSIDTTKELLVAEFAPLGTVSDVLQHVDTMPMVHVITILQQVCAGMEALSSMGFLYQDLALGNVLAFRYEPGDATATSVKLLNVSVRSASARWTAPEVLRGQAATEKSDVWSFGMLAWELLASGRRPFPAAPDGEVAALVLGGERPCRILECPDPLWEVVSRCWAGPPADRPTFELLCVSLEALPPIEMAQPFRLRKPLYDPRGRPQIEAQPRRVYDPLARPSSQVDAAAVPRRPDHDVAPQSSSSELNGRKSAIDSAPCNSHVAASPASPAQAAPELGRPLPMQHAASDAADTAKVRWLGRDTAKVRPTTGTETAAPTATVLGKGMDAKNKTKASTKGESRSTPAPAQRLVGSQSPRDSDEVRRRAVGKKATADARRVATQPPRIETPLVAAAAGGRGGDAAVGWARWISMWLTRAAAAVVKRPALAATGATNPAAPRSSATAVTGSDQSSRRGARPTPAEGSAQAKRRVAATQKWAATGRLRELARATCVRWGSLLVVLMVVLVILQRGAR